MTQNYASLQEVGEQEESGVLFHNPEPSHTRWNHIEDLDSFFSRMYRYHQQHGFICMFLQEFLELFQYTFVVCLTTYLLHCVNYPVLFHDEPVVHNGTDKVTLGDVCMWPGECRKSFGFFTWIALVTAGTLWALRFVRAIYLMVQYWDVKQFFNIALEIEDSELDNLTWHDVQTKIRRVQLEQQMCIHKRELTELDIYHRILRQTNYLVAMTNKGLIPPRFNVPFLGEIVFWTRGLRYNVKWLLFWSPWAPFENSWHLREEYRKPNMRHELARRLGNHILWLAFANLLFSPLILLWQVLYAFFGYAEILKREPGSLGLRNWSLYGQLYLRHFNELDHELAARLNRAHKPASRYLASFHSPVVTILARFVGFMAGAVLAVILLLTVYDEDVISVEHVLTIITVLGGALGLCRASIPNETVAYSPDQLLANVVAHTHYLPRNWESNAHTSWVRKQFQQYFQYIFVAVSDHIISPVVTPYALVRFVYPRTLDIVDFYRNFTVSVVGVGDVCSFAQMDVRKHGNPEWQSPGKEVVAAADQYTQGEDGKVELSLIHFTATNPTWQPPPESQLFIETVNRESMVLPNHQLSSSEFLLHADLNDSSVFKRTFRHEGPLNTTPESISRSTMFLHERHLKQVRQKSQVNAVETTPLLHHTSQ